MLRVVVQVAVGVVFDDDEVVAASHAEQRPPLRLGEGQAGGVVEEAGGVDEFDFGKLPVLVEVVEDLPRTPTGKLRRFVLRAES